MEITVTVRGSFRDTRRIRLKIEELIREIGVDPRKAAVHVHRRPIFHVIRGEECHPNTILVEIGLNPHRYVEFYNNGPTKTMIDAVCALDIIPKWPKRAIVFVFLEP